MSSSPFPRLGVGQESSDILAAVAVRLTAGGNLVPLDFVIAPGRLVPLGPAWSRRDGRHYPWSRKGDAIGTASLSVMV